jgi:ABC-2 type transport system permease protein
MTVQSHPQVTRDLRLAARQGLLPAGGGSWLAGFGNMLSKELGDWVHTRRWLWQLLIWLIIINGLIAFMLWVAPMIAGEEALAPPEVTGLFYFFSTVAMTGTIGVIILAQDEIIQEKQSGTAAWILSKPVARSAFILTKLLANLFGALIIIVLLPGLVTLGEVFLAAHKVMPLGPFLAGAGVILLALVFYLSLVILLGVLFESRGPVLGIAFGVMFFCQLAGNYLPQIALVLPSSMHGIALGVAMREPLPAMAVWGMISTATLSIVFILVALWRFQHIEL